MSREGGRIMETIECIEKYFTEAMLGTIETMTGFNLEVDNCNLVCGECLAENETITGMMMIMGEINMLCMITADKVTAKTLFKYMTGIDGESENFEIYDCISEIVNMVVGTVKGKLSDTKYKFKLSSPIAIVGENNIYITKKNVDRICLQFYSKEIKLNLKVLYL